MINKLISVIHLFTSNTYYFSPIIIYRSSMTNYGASVPYFGDMSRPNITTSWKAAKMHGITNVADKPCSYFAFKWR